MAAIHDLIAQIGDQRLRERLAAEWARATRQRKFRLVFEEHLPELLPLPNARPRKGDLVAPRGGSLKDLWRVRGAKGGRLQCVRPQAGAEAPPEATAEFEPAEVMVDHGIATRRPLRRSSLMFKKILIAHRGDSGRKAVAAKPKCPARAARTGDLPPMEQAHV